MISFSAAMRSDARWQDSGDQIDGLRSLQSLLRPYWDVMTAPDPTRTLVAAIERLESTDCVEKLRLISVRCADFFSWGVGDLADDGRTAGDAGGAVLRLQP